MAKLNVAARKALPTQDFAVKSKAGSLQGKAKGGSYPIPDKNHAKNALARSSGKPVAGEVKAAVKRKFPGIKVGDGKMTSDQAAKSADRIKTRLSEKSKNKTEIGF